MSNRSEVYNAKAGVFSGVAIGSLIGCVLGLVISFLYGIGIAGLFGLRFISGAQIILILAFVCGTLGGLVKRYNINRELNSYKRDTLGRNSASHVIEDIDTDAKLELLAERMDISKELIRTGEVTLRRETVTEEKHITVPVCREELVIEYKQLNVDTEEDEAGSIKTFRIPLREERIEIAKNMVALENVDVYRRQFQESRTISENLRKEKIRIQIDGNLKVKDNEEDKPK